MKRCIMLITVLAAMTVGFAGEEAETPRKVLLVSESTRFKNALIESMQTLLQDKGMIVTVETNSRRNIKAYEAAAFDAVFITNSGVNSKVRPWVVRWLVDNKAEAARILLHTTQTRDWEVNVDVDAVTSASAMADVDDLATRYVMQLLALLEPVGDAGGGDE